MTKDPVWVLFSQEQLEEYLRQVDDAEASARQDRLRPQAYSFQAYPYAVCVRSYLAGVLGLSEHRFQARHAIKLDYASYTLG